MPNYKRKRKSKYSDTTYLKCFKKWINLYGQVLPKAKDVILYNDKVINIGRIIIAIKEGYHKNLKEKVERMFNCKIEHIHRPNRDFYIEACKIWVTMYGYVLPRSVDVININGKIFKIGRFIDGLKQGNSKSLKSEIDKVFNLEIQKIPRPSPTRVSNDEWIEICKSWLSCFGPVLPSQYDIKYYNGKYYNIGTFINGLKRGFHPQIKEEIEKMFNQKIEFSKKR